MNEVFRGHSGAPPRPAREVNPRSLTSPAGGIYRKLLTSERADLREHLLRLTVEDRCMRFCGGVGEAHIDYYCAHADDRHRLVVGYFVDEVLRGAGEIVFLGEPTWGKGCEIALSVEQPYQNRGVGSELLRRLLVLARNRGAATVLRLCLGENRKMQALADKFKAELRFDGSEVSGTLYPRWPTGASLLEETLSDSYGVMSLAFGSGHRSHIRRAAAVAP